MKKVMHLAVFRPRAEGKHLPLALAGSVPIMNKVRDVGSKNTHKEMNSISKSDFCVAAVHNEDNHDVLSLLEVDLETKLMSKWKIPW